MMQGVDEGQKNMGGRQPRFVARACECVSPRVSPGVFFTGICVVLLGDHHGHCACGSVCCGCALHERVRGSLSFCALSMATFEFPCHVLSEVCVALLACVFIVLLVVALLVCSWCFSDGAWLSCEAFAWLSFMCLFVCFR